MNLWSFYTASLHSHGRLKDSDGCSLTALAFRSCPSETLLQRCCNRAADFSQLPCKPPRNTLHIFSHRPFLHNALIISARNPSFPFLTPPRFFHRKQELDRASHFGKRVEFSSDGKLSVLLGPGDKLLGWQGETPIVSRAQSMSQQENTPAPGLDISPVVNALVNPQTWQVPPPSANELELQQIADRNRAKTQMFIDEQRAKADYQREKYFELLEKRSKEIGKMKFAE